MPDPRGAPNDARRRFWRALRAGFPLEEAAEAGGLSLGSAHRWIRESGGMPPLCLSEPSTTRKLSMGDREALAHGLASGASLAGVSDRLCKCLAP